MIFGQDDEEFWASIPVIGSARKHVISTYEDIGDTVTNIPDTFWNDIPVLGPIRKAALSVQAATSIPAWVWIVVPAGIAALAIVRVVVR